ncbi:hypothetical protein HXX76_001472 [Chlamydomonas incerta]|uniref:Uncharacterized protein n=1 Tax=Chlamydomonas incerta TaxID=51695 RepID=A0A836B1N2_CHLIN|nr:hypothetical protein HXX76_001472 [Chlamydomonas incerta]|eukprot:KAG2444728.1 hypothetical protein HXX76_001472 [Chlamydomonas incerta]
MAAEGAARVWRASAAPSRSSSVSLDQLCAPAHRHEGSARFIPSGEHNSAAFFTPLASIQNLDDVMDELEFEGARAAAYVTQRMPLHRASSSSLRLHAVAAGGPGAAALAYGAGQIASGGSRGLAPTRLSRAGDSLTLLSDAGTLPHRPRDSVDVLRAFLDDGPASIAAPSQMASASALEFPVNDAHAAASQPAAAVSRGRCSVDWSAPAAAAQQQQQQQAARPPDCVAQVLGCHLPIGEDPGEGEADEGERDRGSRSPGGDEGADEERRTSRTSASSAASGGSQLSASSMGLPTSGSVYGAGSTPRGGNSHKGMAASATPPAASGSTSVPPPGASSRSISHLLATVSGLGGSRSVGSTGYAAGAGSRPDSASGVRAVPGSPGVRSCDPECSSYAAASSSQPGMARGMPPLAPISTGRASVGAGAPGAASSASSFGQPLHGGMLSSLRKAASDVVSQLRALRPGKGGTGAATPTATATATPTAAATAAHGSVFTSGGNAGPGQHQPQVHAQVQPRLLHTVHECSFSQPGWQAAQGRGSNAGGGRNSCDGNALSHYAVGPAPQGRARAPSASAAWASVPPQYDGRSPSLGKAGTDAVRSPWVTPGHLDVSGSAGGMPVDPMLLPCGHSISVGTAGASTGVGMGAGPRGQFLDEVGLEPQASDLMPDMWDLARVMDELEDGWGPRGDAATPGASAAGGPLAPTAPVARASPVLSVGPQRAHRTHASTAPVGLLDTAEAEADGSSHGGMQRLQAAFAGAAAAAAAAGGGGSGGSGSGRARSSVGMPQGATTRFASGVAVSSVPGLLVHGGATAPRAGQYPVSMPAMTASVAATAAALGLRGNDAEQMYILVELVQTARASENARRSPHVSGAARGVVYTASASNSGAVTAADAAAMAAAAAAASRGSNVPARTPSSGASAATALPMAASVANAPRPYSGSGCRDGAVQSGDSPPPPLQQQLAAAAAAAVTAARGSISSANGHCGSLLTSSMAESSLWSSSMQSSAVMPFHDQNPTSLLNIAAAGGAASNCCDSANLSGPIPRVLATGIPAAAPGLDLDPASCTASAAVATTSAGAAAVDASPFTGLHVANVIPGAGALATPAGEAPGSPWHGGAPAPSSASASAVARAANGPGSANKVPGHPTATYIAAAFGSTFRAGSNLGSGSGGFSRASTAALNSGPGGGSAPGPELAMVWPLVMPTTVPALLAGEPGDEADGDGNAAASGGPFSLHVLVSCGCGAAYGCYCAPPEAAGDAAADSHTCTPPGSALSLARTLAAPDARRAAAAAAAAAIAAAEEKEQRLTVNAMLSGVQLACVPLQDGGGCQGALLRLPQLPAMQLVNVFTAGDGAESAAAAGPATNLLAVPPAMAAELHALFAERVRANLQRLNELTADGEDAAAAAAQRRDLELLRHPCARGAPPPWRLSPAVWAACRSEWRGSMQPLLADICYLLLCVPNCFSHGLVEWDRAMYCETLARLLGQLERYKLWATISVLLEYCRRQGVALLYQGEAVGAGSLSAERVRALLEGALHDEISIKAVDRGAQAAGGGGGGGGVRGGGPGGGGGGFGFQVGGQAWAAAPGLSAQCSGDDGAGYGGTYSSLPAPGAAAAAMAAALGASSGSTGGAGSGARARRASVTALVPPDAADAATAYTLKAWRRRSVDTPAMRAAHADEAAAAAAGRGGAPPPAASSGAGFTAGSALLPPMPGPAPVRTLRSQASIGRVLTRVLTALGAGEDDAAHTPVGTPRTPLNAAAAAQPFADVGPASAAAPGPAAASTAGVTAAATRGQRLGHVIEGAAVVLAFAGVMLQSLL